MSRYADHSQEILYREGKLIGFNAGYGFHSEHEWGYKGMEQIQPSKPRKKDKQSNPFSKEIVRNPKMVHLMELNDSGNVFLTNDEFYYYEMLKKSEEDRNKRMEALINNKDRKQTADFLERIGMQPEQPEVIALWNESDFYLLSTNENSSELLKTLYKEMQKGNVAISSDYSFLFKDRGLSFILLDQLTQDDIMKKQLIDHQKEIAKQFEKEYNDFLEKEGLAGFDTDMNYPIRFANVQINKVDQTDKGMSPEFYLELYHIVNGEWDNNSCLFNVPRHMSGNEIKFLVPIVKSKDFEKFATSHSKEDVETYINEQLEKYHEQQRLTKKQEYQIGKESLNAIATEQRTETVEKRKMSLGDRIKNWLNPDKVKSAKEKGE